MRYAIAMLILTGVSACAVRGSDAAFCGPDYTGAIDRLAKELDHPSTRDPLGQAGTAVVVGHDAGCGLMRP